MISMQHLSAPPQCAASVRILIQPLPQRHMLGSYRDAVMRLGRAQHLQDAILRVMCPTILASGNICLSIAQDFCRPVRRRMRPCLRKARPTT